MILALYSRYSNCFRENGLLKMWIDDFSIKRFLRQSDKSDNEAIITTTDLEAMK